MQTIRTKGNTRKETDSHVKELDGVLSVHHLARKGEPSGLAVRVDVHGCQCVVHVGAPSTMIGSAVVEEREAEGQSGEGDGEGGKGDGGSSPVRTERHRSRGSRSDGTCERQSTAV